MAEKSKKKDDEKKKATAVEPKKETRSEEKSAPVPAASATPAPPPRRGTLGPARPRPAAISVVASATGTAPVVLGALKTAYGWTDRTRLTRREFLRKRDEWLVRPASEV